MCRWLHFYSRIHVQGGRYWTDPRTMTAATPYKYGRGLVDMLFFLHDELNSLST